MKTKAQNKNISELRRKIYINLLLFILIIMSLFGTIISWRNILSPSSGNNSFNNINNNSTWIESSELSNDEVVYCNSKINQFMPPKDCINIIFNKDYAMYSCKGDLIYEEAIKFIPKRN